MRLWSAFLVAGAFAGCTGSTIDAGTNHMGDAGRGSGGGGLTIIASQIQATPDNLVSDGTTLFWVSGVGAGGPVSSMPVGGGTISTIAPGPIGSRFLAVDDVNVYYLGANGIYRAPKGGGGAPSLVNEAMDAGTTSISAVTALRTDAYWLELQQELSTSQPPILMTTATVKSAPLQGGGVSTIAEVVGSLALEYIAIGVTSTAVFLSTPVELDSFLLGSGVPDGSVPAQIPGVSGMAQSCGTTVLSDTDAIYCESLASIFRVASNGTATVLGTAYGGTNGIAFDDTYVYWVDALTVGTLMRVPKTGGTASILARDTSPVAIAVDANAVYWSDVGGTIMRLAK